MPLQFEDASREPWLCGTRSDVPAVTRAVLHALDLARSDFARWVWSMSADQAEQTPFGLPSAAFHARHITRSLDRLLTYAEGRQLTEEQHEALRSERIAQAGQATREEFERGLRSAEARVLELSPGAFEEPREVGRAKLLVTLGGLLVHLADHTQRHAGQAVTTAKVVLALEQSEQS